MGRCVFSFGLNWIFSLYHNDSVHNNPASVGTSNEENDTTCDVDDAFFLTANMVVAADGTSRTVANEMERNDKERWEGLNTVQRLFAEKPFSIKRYEVSKKIRKHRYLDVDMDNKQRRSIVCVFISCLFHALHCTA